nr:immunoglobulin heavy chain junction region [Macaca mulatta]
CARSAVGPESPLLGVW